MVFSSETQKINIDGIKIENRNYTISSLLTRIGLLNNFELRLGGDYIYQITKMNYIQTDNFGFDNLLIGAKYQYMKEELNGEDLGSNNAILSAYREWTLSDQKILSPKFSLQRGKLN